jgi:hypothetical protein
MADPVARVQVTIPRDSGLPRDSIVNVWHFEGDDDPLEDDRDRFDSLAGGLADRVKTFYTAISSLFAVTCNPDLVSLKIYDLNDAEPRIPRHEETFDMGSTASDTLPNEVALCLSMRGQLTAGTNQARRRGRVYLGPFGHAATEGAIIGADARPAASICGSILSHADTMARGVGGSFRLAVFSPATFTGANLSESMTDVSYMWIDNAWDTQRRRGAAATHREFVDLGS